jgi:hypothetical protein
MILFTKKQEGFHEDHEAAADKSALTLSARELDQPGPVATAFSSIVVPARGPGDCV